MELRYSPYQRKKNSRKPKTSHNEAVWTPEEDSLLREGVCKFGGKKWKAIAELIELRSPDECNRRWNHLQGLGQVTKRPWSPEEDNYMRELVEKYGASKWAVIASYLAGRNGKQCRERWHNQLNPSIKKSPWTEEENEIILSMQATYGNCWAKITSCLPGRTDNAVKNHWHSSLKSQAKQYPGGREKSVVRKGKKKALPSRKSKTPRPSKKQSGRTAKLAAIANAGLGVDTDMRPVTRASAAVAAATAAIAATFSTRSLSPDSVSNVDSPDLHCQSLDDAIYPAQAVIDSILDPMGMGACITRDFDLSTQRAGEMTIERCMASWRAGDEEFCAAASNAESPLDPTSPAQPPFGLDELLYDSLHDLCGCGTESTGLALTTPLGEVAKIYPQSMFMTRWGNRVTFPSPPATAPAPALAAPTPYVSPDLSPIDHTEDMPFQFKEEPPPVKNEIAVVERDFMPVIPGTSGIASDIGVEV